MTSNARHELPPGRTGRQRGFRPSSSSTRWLPGLVARPGSRTASSLFCTAGPGALRRSLAPCRMQAGAVALPVSVRGERDLAAALEGADLVPVAP
jgi:hypothetical protein